MNETTEFQANCEQKLKQFLNANENINVLSWKVEGDKEKFIHIKLNVNDIEIWIYKQESMFVCAGKDVHFEAADYPDKENLLIDFVDALSYCVIGKNVSDFGSGFVKIFDGGKL